MPAKSDLVAEAVARLDTLGLRSQILKLSSEMLCDLGLRLTDRNVTVLDCWKWLNAQQGVDVADSDQQEVVDQNAVYRYAEHFRRIYGQIRGEHARRVARLTVEHATDASVRQMGAVAVHRLTELVAERLVESDSLGDLSGGELNAAIATLDGLSRAEFKRQDLALRAAEAEGKARKLEADLALARQKLDDLPRRVRVIEQQLQAAQAALETPTPANTRKAAGLFAAIRQELVSLSASPTPA